MTQRLMLCALMLAAGLSACGGSDDTPAPMPPAPPPPVVSNEVPASATASPLAYSQYAGSLVASDIAEPLDVDKVVPPTSETDEPIDIG